MCPSSEYRVFVLPHLCQQWALWLSYSLIYRWRNAMRWYLSKNVMTACQSLSSLAFTLVWTQSWGPLDHRFVLLAKFPKHTSVCVTRSGVDSWKPGCHWIVKHLEIPWKGKKNTQQCYPCLWYSLPVLYIFSNVHWLNQFVHPEEPVQMPLPFPRSKQRPRSSPACCLFFWLWLASSQLPSKLQTCSYNNLSSIFIGHTYICFIGETFS